MRILTAFAVIPGPESWEKNEEGEIVIFEHDEGTSDFVIGTFSSLEKAKEGVEKFLKSYVPGDERQLETIGQYFPILDVTFWQTELDEGEAKGELVYSIVVAVPETDAGDVSIEN